MRRRRPRPTRFGVSSARRRAVRRVVIVTVASRNDCGVAVFTLPRNTPEDRPLTGPDDTAIDRPATPPPAVLRGVGGCSRHHDRDSLAPSSFCRSRCSGSRDDGRVATPAVVALAGRRRRHDLASHDLGRRPCAVRATPRTPFLLGRARVSALVSVASNAVRRRRGDRRPAADACRRDDGGAYLFTCRNSWNRCALEAESRDACGRSDLNQRRDHSRRPGPHRRSRAHR